jgi:hypothetical protein
MLGPKGAPKPTPNAIFLTPVEAGELLRISPVTLARWRVEGIGPPHRKFGRRVVYAKSDLLAWAENQTQQSTSQRTAQYNITD